MYHIHYICNQTRNTMKTKHYYQMELAYYDGRPNHRGDKFDSKAACESACEQMNSIREWKEGKWVCVRH